MGCNPPENDEQCPDDTGPARSGHWFKPLELIDPIYFERTCYVGPKESGVKTYRVLISRRPGSKPGCNPNREPALVGLAGETWTVRAVRVAESHGLGQGSVAAEWLGG